jgi:hypothetical protein
MSAAVLCAGCGGTVRVPDDFGRERIRCPECGVFCPVPASARQRSAERPAAPRQEKGGTGDPPVRTGGTPVPPAVPRCPVCGQDVPVPGRCAECEAAAALAAPAARAPKPRRSDVPIDPDADPEPEPEPEPVPMTVVRPGKRWTREDEDGSPYDLGPGQEERRCPRCAKVLKEEDKVVCPECDFDLVRNRPAIRVYQPIDQTWVSGMGVALRWQLFMTIEVLMFFSALLVSALLEDYTTLLPMAIFCTPLWWFVLGTYFRIRLSRNTKGRVRVEKVWYVCFLGRSPRRLYLGDYEGVASGVVNEGKFWEWVLLLPFLAAGLIPAIFWWYFAIHQDIYFTSLTRDHGFPDEPIYRGWSEERMRETERLMREIAGLKH